ncbi:MAG: methyltransferase domain-containing protein [Candidatus Nanoarchaeia archaeon]|nr:methyltransferase domain-containing protein [Candidatus Nanoarchaeia archaeon]
MNEVKFFDDYYTKGYDAWDVLGNEIRKDKFMKRIEIIRGLLNKINCSDKKVLDVGGGNGFFAKNLKCKNIYCADISTNALISGKNNYSGGVTATAIKLPFKDETFDVVMCVETLYYNDHEKMMSEMARVTKKEGYLIICLGNKNCIKRKIYRLLGYNVDDGNIYSKNNLKWYEKRLSVKELKNLITKYNYEIKMLRGVLFFIPLISKNTFLRQKILFPLGDILKNYANQNIYLAVKK